MDSTIEGILATSDRAFLHNVLHDLCIDNAFVCRAVLEHFAALPSDSNAIHQGARDAMAGDDKAPNINAKREDNTSSDQEAVKPETARGASFSLYDIPLAPSAIPAPSPAHPSFNQPAPHGSSAASRKRPRSSTDISTDAMVIDDDEEDGYQTSISRVVGGSSGDVPGDDAATLYHDGSDDDSDNDISSSSDQQLAHPVQHRLLPAAISDRVPDATRSQTRQNLYKAIYDHQDASEKIESLNEQLMDCKNPVKIERISSKLHRLDIQRRACRDIIENMLTVEDRESAQANFTAAERYNPHHAAQNRQRGIFGEEGESLVARRARIEAESRQSTKSRIDGMLEEEEKSHRMSQLLEAAKQAARKGAKRLKKSLADEERKNRQWSAKKRREREAQKYAYRGRKK